MKGGIWSAQCCNLFCEQYKNVFNLRYSNLDEDWENFCKENYLEYVPLKIENKIQYDDDVVVSKKDKEKIMKMCWLDCRNFGYKVEDILKI